MARVRLIESKTDLDPQHHAAWDAITESRGRIVVPTRCCFTVQRPPSGWRTSAPICGSTRSCRAR
jgi:hypothetical protein